VSARTVLVAENPQLCGWRIVLGLRGADCVGIVSWWSFAVQRVNRTGIAGKSRLGSIQNNDEEYSPKGAEIGSNGTCQD
jgi:hypothetical protein